MTSLRQLHDGRHAGAESRPEHASPLICNRSLCSHVISKNPRNSWVPEHIRDYQVYLDQREETGARFGPHRGCSIAFPL